MTEVSSARFAVLIPEDLHYEETHALPWMPAAVQLVDSGYASTQRGHKTSLDGVHFGRSLACSRRLEA